MRAFDIDERVRDYVAAERAQMSVPPLLAPRILRAIEKSDRPRRTPRLGYLRLAAAMAAVLVLAAGIGVIRASQSPAGLSQGAWSSTRSMAVPRAYHTATLLRNGKVLVVGGRGVLDIPAPWQPASGNAISSAELYDPQTGIWSSAGTLLTPRFGHTATRLNDGRVLVAGGNKTLPGLDRPPDSVSSAELYDPLTNTWSSAGNMSTPRSFQTATLLADGRVLVVGGIDSTNVDAGQVLPSAELFDPATNSWTVAAPLPSARANHSAILLSDGRVLVVGGIDHRLTQPSGFEAITGVETAVLYNPATNAWSPAASMSFTRTLPTLTLLPDGRVLVVGDGGIHARTAEIFDPAKNLWLQAPPPSVGRTVNVAVLLHSGAVLVAGGTGQTSAQLYDPRRNSWSSAGALSVMRSGGTATVLPNGHVLVVGGFGNGTTPWSSADIYDPAGIPPAAIRVRTSAPLAWTELAVAMAALVGLVLSVWVSRRRQARSLRSGDIWIDS